jgi:dCMP deaminase
MTDWDRWFLDIAKVVATKAKDPSTKVGAVIADDKNRLVSVGYNGYPRGIPDEGMDNREEKLMKTIHAEENAILFSKRDLTGCTLYVYPFFVCGPCMSKIVQTGISRVVCEVEDPNSSVVKRWEKSTNVALEIARKAGIEVILVEP